MLRSEGDRALIEQGFCYESGSLTKEGRKVVINLLFQNDDALRQDVTEIALNMQKK